LCDLNGKCGIEPFESSAVICPENDENPFCCFRHIDSVVKSTVAVLSSQLIT